MAKDLTTRMKAYEACYEYKFPSRSYVIIRLDGKGFSKYTKQFNKPFDDILSNVMDVSTIDLCGFLNPVLAYTQSDEISLLFTNNTNIESEPIFNGKIQKLCSISASKVTSSFNKNMLTLLSNFKYEDKDVLYKIRSGDFKEIDAVFDSRVFVLPDITEVMNYFIWRQKDCTRNSISMAASAYFSHKQLQGKSGSDKQNMLFLEKGVNWNDYLPKYKRGVIIKKEVIYIDGEGGQQIQRNKWLPDYNTPIFTENKDYLKNLIPTVTI